jgi:indole-3-glycerol phosphate synthase
METILDKIIAVKKEEVKVLRNTLQTFTDVTNQRRSFIKKLEKANDISIIAEFKRASPSKGDINSVVDPKVQAELYTKAGADAVSVLTDSTFFKGSLQDLTVVSSTTENPVLCKDFIIDSIQIDAAKQAGADIILLIAAALNDEQLHKLYQYAREKDLEVLMEVHDEIEAERVLKTDNRLIGVNNRNLKTFEVNLEVTEKIAPLIKREGRFLISESGMKTMEDVERVAKVGANGILVGETFMKHSSPEEAIRQMKLPLVEVTYR